MSKFLTASLALVLLAAITVDARPVDTFLGRSLLQGVAGAPSPSSSDPILVMAAAAVSNATQKDIGDFIAGNGNSTYEANLIATAIANASLTALNEEADGSMYSDETTAANAVANAVNAAFIKAVAAGSNNSPTFIANAQAANLNQTIASALLAPAPAASPSGSTASAGKAAEPKNFLKAIKAVTQLVMALAPVIQGILDHSKMG